MTSMRWPACLALAIALAACTRPQPPDTERPPEPQAQQPSAMRDAIQVPVGKVQAAEAAVQEATERQQAAIEAAGG